MIILLSKFRVTKISVSYITGENHIGSSFIRQTYFCLPIKIAFLPTKASNKISGGGGGVSHQLQFLVPWEHGKVKFLCFFNIKKYL
jgi:hypothetical protein